MRFAALIAGALLSLAPSVLAVDKLVFAHYMLGEPGADVWATTIANAQAAGIDAFALNAASTYGDASNAISQAYTAAEKAGFKMFISFDMGASTFDVNTVASWINAHKDSSAQLEVDGKPFVSTFEGCDFHTGGSWNSVKSSTGDLYLVPSFSYCGDASAVSSALSYIDGAFNWVAWPNGPGPMTKDGDNNYVNALDGKAYMMPVSPWMYTNLQEYSKNWLLGSDSLWYDRWEQVIDVNPQFVEIITWNDFGESHYIGDQSQGTVDAEEAVFANDMSHVGWQKALPYYIAAYKAGSRSVAIPEETAIFWYRTTPKAVCGDGSTACPANSDTSATACTSDVVNVMTMSKTSTTVTVTIGSTSKTFSVGYGVNFVQMPFDGNTGDVKVSMNGKSATGPKQITNTCPSSGYVNFNPVVGST